MPKPVSERQEAICGCIAWYVLNKQWPPDMREIGTWAGMPSTGHVDYHLNALVQKGYLEREPGHRCIRLTEEGREIAQAYLARMAAESAGAA